MIFWVMENCMRTLQASRKLLLTLRIGSLSIATFAFVAIFYGAKQIEGFTPLTSSKPLHVSVPVADIPVREELEWYALFDPVFSSAKKRSFNAPWSGMHLKVNDVELDSSGVTPLLGLDR